jgi:beta-glucosidase
MKKGLRILLIILGSIIGLLLAVWLVFEARYWVVNYQAKAQLAEKATLIVDDEEFRDLNGNDRLDIYEDYRQPVDKRVEDLLSRMTLAEKVGLMWHPPIGMGSEGEVLARPSPSSFFFGSTYDFLINKKLRHFNLFQVAPPRQHAEWYNALQRIAEQDRLGIPVTISSDPRHGANNFLGGDMLGGEFSKWPEPVGLAAIGDSMLTVEFGRIANQEYRAVGIRTALHPMADLATEPRWARINGTFGEDAELAAKMTAAYIYGFQGDSLGAHSVACMTKHWPGGGPQEDGEDAHFDYGANQVYPGNNFDYHLLPFEAAFEAGTAMIMPYYGVPVGQTSEEVAMNFNKEIITDLLRNKYGYDGIVCTDWSVIEGFSVLGFEIFPAKDYGVENLSVKARIRKAIEAGVDQFGGNSNTEELIELVEEGTIAEARIDASVRRLLRAKFEMGLFEDPYVDAEKAAKIVGKQEFMEKGKRAQRRSIVLLKNGAGADGSRVLPLPKGTKIYTENIDDAAASKYGTVVATPEEADFAVLRLQTPWEPRDGDFVEAFFHQGALNFPEQERSRLLDIMQTTPTIVCIYLDRAAVIPEIAEASAGLLADFGATDDAVLDVIFGDFNPKGKLPFELPASMEAVRNQKEDVPYDSKDPLFEFGYGPSYDRVSENL